MGGNTPGQHLEDIPRQERGTPNKTGIPQTGWGIPRQNRGTPRQDRDTLRQDRGIPKQDRGTLRQDRGTLRQDRGTLRQDRGTPSANRRTEYASSRYAGGLSHALHYFNRNLSNNSCGRTPGSATLHMTNFRLVIKHLKNETLFKVDTMILKRHLSVLKKTV